MKGQDKELIRIATDLRITKNQKKELTQLRTEFMRTLRSELSRLPKSKNEFNLRLKMEYIGGSIKKSTAMRFNPDIDVVSLFEFDSETGNPPTVRKVLKFLNSLTLDGFNCKLGGTALTISRKGVSKIGGKSNLSMDLVPALSNPSRHGKSPVGKWWWQIDPKGIKEWIKFNPVIQDEIMKKLHRRAEPDDPTALLICLKRWRDLCLKRWRDLQKKTPKKLSSYVLEVLVWNEYRKRPGQNQTPLVERFNNVLESFNDVKNGLRFKGSSMPPKSKSRIKNPPFIQNPANAHMDILGMSLDEFQWWIKQSKVVLKGNSTVETVFN